MAAGDRASSCEWQWKDGRDPLLARARRRSPTGTGLAKLCLELHGQQNVYNVPDAASACARRSAPTVGAELRPEPPDVDGRRPDRARSTRSATRSTTCTRRTRGIEPAAPALNSRMETKPERRGCAERSWNYVTLGYGNDAAFWRSFCLALRAVGYDDVLSIEHEDVSMTPEEGVRESVAVLHDAIVARPV